MTCFDPTRDPPMGGSGLKTTTFVKDHEYFISTKFSKYLSSGSEVKADYVLHTCIHALMQPRLPSPL